MSEFKTKQEVVKAAAELDANAERWEVRAKEHSAPQFAGFLAAGYRADAAWARMEAKRIRAMLPTLPD